MVYVSGRGSSQFSGLTPAQRNAMLEANVSFVPFADQPPVSSPYDAAVLTAADYEEFIRPDDEIAVWTVPAVLAAFDWTKRGRSAASQSRRARLSNFISLFFDEFKAFDDGDGGYNSNWCAVDLGAEVGGWTRISDAQNWLDANPDKPRRICDTPKANTAMSLAQCAPFVRFLSDKGLSIDAPDAPVRFDTWKEFNPGAC